VGGRRIERRFLAPGWGRCGALFIAFVFSVCACQGLPWRRVDVSFKDTKYPFFAHNHIQVRGQPGQVNLSRCLTEKV
jgi:hypothetical protein